MPVTDAPSRPELLARWQSLTRDILPAMAPVHAWPIRLDHCFMRVCLDAALEARWDRRVRRPAIRHLTDDQLARAVSIAESVAASPGLLPDLNQASLERRRAVSAEAPLGRHAGQAHGKDG